MNGHDRIKAERERQKAVEGWSEDHDDEHWMGELASAAECYVRTGGTICACPGSWPWSSEWWKPSGDKNRDLEKAGALFLAEAERLERAAKMARARAYACGLMIEDVLAPCDRCGASVIAGSEDPASGIILCQECRR